MILHLQTCLIPRQQLPWEQDHHTLRLGCSPSAKNLFSTHSANFYASKLTADSIRPPQVEDRRAGGHKIIRESEKWILPCYDNKHNVKSPRAQYNETGTNKPPSEVHALLTEM